MGPCAHPSPAFAAILFRLQPSVKAVRHAFLGGFIGYYKHTEAKSGEVDRQRNAKTLDATHTKVAGRAHRRESIAQTYGAPPSFPGTHRHATPAQTAGNTHLSAKKW